MIIIKKDKNFPEDYKITYNLKEKAFFKNNKKITLEALFYEISTLSPTKRKNLYIYNLIDALDDYDIKKDKLAF
jgi:hypothetical protein